MKHKTEKLTKPKFIFWTLSTIDKSLASLIKKKKKAWISNFRDKKGTITKDIPEM